MMKFLAILFLVTVTFYLSGCGLFKSKTETLQTSSYTHNVNDSANSIQNDSLRANIIKNFNVVSTELGSFNTTLYFKPNTPTKFNPDGSFTGTVDSSKIIGQTNKKTKASDKMKADVSTGSKTNTNQGRNEGTVYNNSNKENKSKPPNWLLISLVLVAAIIVVVVVVKVFKT